MYDITSVPYISLYAASLDEGFHRILFLAIVPFPSSRESCISIYRCAAVRLLLRNGNPAVAQG